MLRHGLQACCNRLPHHCFLLWHILTVLQPFFGSLRHKNMPLSQLYHGFLTEGVGCLRVESVVCGVFSNEGKRAEEGGRENTLCESSPSLLCARLLNCNKIVSAQTSSIMCPEPRELGPME